MGIIVSYWCIIDNMSSHIHPYIPFQSNQRVFWCWNRNLSVPGFPTAIKWWAWIFTTNHGQKEDGRSNMERFFPLYICIILCTIISQTLNVYMVYLHTFANLPLNYPKCTVGTFFPATVEWRLIYVLQPHVSAFLEGSEMIQGNLLHSTPICEGKSL